MIRILIGAAVVLVVWILLFSGLSKTRKRGCIVALGLFVLAGLWFEGYSKTPRAGRIQDTDIVACGIKAKRSYRDNFDIEYCFKNQSTTAVVKRMNLRFSVMLCKQADCDLKQTVDRDHVVDIDIGETVWMKDNLAFASVRDAQGDLQWKVDVLSVKAL